jgi:hypothetical protein
MQNRSLHCSTHRNDLLSRGYFWKAGTQIPQRPNRYPRDKKLVQYIVAVIERWLTRQRGE